MIARLVYIFLVCCTWSLQVAQSQVTIYTENFDSYGDGTMSGNSWNVPQHGKCDGSADWSFGVKSNAFTIENVEGENCGCPNASGGDNSNIAEFGNFDITNYCNVSVSFDITAMGILECSDGGSEDAIYCPPTVAGSGRDVIQVEAIVDGNTTILYFACGSTVVTDNRAVVLNGTSLRLRIIGGTGTVDEIYTFDNLEIQGFETNGDITITADKSSPICEGESITLTAQNSGPWDWNTGEQTKSITKTPSIGSTTYSVEESIGCALDRGFFTVVVFQSIVANAGADTEICQGQTTTLEASGGTTYRWDDNSTNRFRDVSPSTTSTYAVTVSNGICTDIDEVVVTVKPNPVVSTGSDITICAGEPATLTASGANFYSWTPDGPNVSPSTTMTYTVTGTSNGCSDSDQMTVFVNPIPTATISGNTRICEGETITLTGSGGINYDWDPGSATGSSINISPTSTTTYTLTVTDNNGCKDTETHTVNVERNPVANAGSDQEICNGESVRLTASGGTDYIWDFNNTTGAELTVSPTSDATYSVTVSNGMCTDSDQVNVIVNDKPNADITGTLEICAGESTRLTAVGTGSYNWSTNSNNSFIDVSPVSTETYALTVSSNGCDSVITKTIVVKPRPEISIGNDTTICEGSEITLTATGASTYIWEDGSTNNTFTLSPMADRIVSVTGESNGCSAVAEIQISVQETFVTDAGDDELICEGKDVILTATGGDSFLWSNGDINQSITINIQKDTTYFVEATMGACTAMDSVKITTSALPTPEVVGSLSYCPGSSTTIKADQEYATITWDLNGTISNTSFLEVAQDGIVSLMVADNLGCEGDTMVMIEENPSLNPIISGKLTLCENGTNELSVETGFDNYLWSNGSTDSNTSVTAGGEYSIYVSTDDGCEGRDTVVVEQVTNPDVDISGLGGFCLGESTILSIDDFPTISWFDGSSNDSIIISAPGDVSVSVMDDNGCTGSDMVTVTELLPPDVRIVGDTTFCSGDSVRHEVRGNFTLPTWHDGSTLSAIYITQSQISRVEVEDRFGCRNFAEVMVEEKALPTADIVAPSLICEGSETQIFTTESHASYTWNQNINTDTFTINTGGTYTVEVSNEDGCVDTDEVIISSVDPPLLRLKENLELCNSAVQSRAEPTQLLLDTVFAETSASGIWSSPHSNIDLTNLPLINFEGLAPGIYDFIYTSNDAIAPCEDIAQILSVTLFDCQCPNITFVATDTLCSIGGMLDLSTIQSSDFEGSWQVTDGPDSEMPSISNDIFNADDQMPGEYEIQFRLIDGIAPLGCADAKSLNIVVAPHINASLELIDPACGDNPATLQVNLEGGDIYNVNLQQDDNQVISLSNISDGHQFQTTLTGKTAFVFRDIQSNIQTCDFQSDEDIYAFSPGELDAVVETSQFGDFETSCSDAADGTAAVLINIGTAPYIYQWSNGSDLASVNGLAAGDYSVTVEDATGCVYNESISISAPPEKLITIEPIDPMCGIGPGALAISPKQGITLEGDWEYYLDGSLLSQRMASTMISSIDPGLHTLEVISPLGCSETHDFDIDDDSDQIIGINDVSIGLGQSVVLAPTINFDYESIVWSPSTYLTDSSTQVVSVDRPLRTVTYTIQVTDTEGCIKEAQVNVNVNKERSLLIPTGFTPNGDLNNSDFIIHATSAVVAINSITIYDRLGEEIFTATDVLPNQPIGWDWTFRNKNLPAGQYIWRASATFIDMESTDFSGHFEIIR